MCDDIAVPIYSVRADYSELVTDPSTWTELLASLPQTCQLVEIFDSGGETMRLGVGAVGQEQQYILITPGGNGKLPLFLAVETRLTLQPYVTAPTEGEIVINFYQQ